MYPAYEPLVRTSNERRGERLLGGSQQERRELIRSPESLPERRDEFRINQELS
jgi:hypothetical protein